VHWTTSHMDIHQPVLCRQDEFRHRHFNGADSSAGGGMVSGGGSAPLSCSAETSAKARASASCQDSPASWCWFASSPQRWRHSAGQSGKTSRQGQDKGGGLSTIRARWMAKWIRRG
jgi:hypothetical protein